MSATKLAGENETLTSKIETLASENEAIIADRNRLLTIMAEHGIQPE